MGNCVCVFKCSLYPSPLLLCAQCMCVLFFRRFPEVASSFHTHREPFFLSLVRALTLFITWISNLFVRTYLDGLVYDISSVFMVHCYHNSIVWEKKGEEIHLDMFAGWEQKRKKTADANKKKYMYLWWNFFTAATATTAAKSSTTSHNQIV